MKIVLYAKYSDSDDKISILTEKEYRDYLKVQYQLLLHNEEKSFELHEILTEFLNLEYDSSFILLADEETKDSIWKDFENYYYDTYAENYNWERVEIDV